MTTQDYVDINTSNTPSYSSNSTYESSVPEMTTQSETSRTTVDPPDNTDESDAISAFIGQSMTFYLVIGGIVFGLMLVTGCLVISFQAALKAKCRRKRRRPVASEPESPIEPATTTNDEIEGGYERIPAHIQSICETATGKKSTTSSHSARDHTSGYISMATASPPSQNNSDDIAGCFEFADNTPSDKFRTKRTNVAPIPVPPVYINTTSLSRDAEVAINNQGTELVEIKGEKPQLPPRTREKRTPSDTFERDYNTTTLSTFPTSNPKTPRLESRKMNTLPTVKQTNTHADIIHTDMDESNPCATNICTPNDFQLAIAESISNRIKRSSDTQIKHSADTDSHCDNGLDGGTSKDSVHNPEYRQVGFTEITKDTQVNKMATLEREYSQSGQLPHSCHGQTDVSDESGYMYVSEDGIYTLPDHEESIYSNYVTTLAPLLADSMASNMQVQQQMASAERSADDTGGRATLSSRDSSTFEIVLTVHRPKGKRPKLDYVVR